MTFRIRVSYSSINYPCQEELDWERDGGEGCDGPMYNVQSWSGTGRGVEPEVWSRIVCLLVRTADQQAAVS